MNNSNEANVKHEPTQAHKGSLGGLKGDIRLADNYEQPLPGDKEFTVSWTGRGGKFGSSRVYAASAADAKTGMLKRRNVISVELVIES